MARHPGRIGPPRRPTTTERTVRAVSHPEWGTIYHLYPQGSEFTLCREVLPVRGLSYADAARGDCAGCLMQARVDESIAKRRGS